MPSMAGRGAAAVAGAVSQGWGLPASQAWHRNVLELSPPAPGQGALPWQGGEPHQPEAVGRELEGREGMREPPSHPSLPLSE